MIAPGTIDLRLIRYAGLTGGLLVLNYAAWALHAPVLLAMASVAAAGLAVVFFLVQRPIAKDLPLKLFIVAAILLTLGTPTPDWDARSIWMFHAKRIYFDASLYASFDNYASWSNNDYPDFVPAISATLAHLLGHWSESALKIGSVLALFPALLVTVACLKGGTRQLLFVSLLLFICGKLLFDGYMDGLLAAYFCAAAFLLFALIQRPSPPKDLNLTLAAVALIIVTILSLTKNEGVAAVAALLLAAALLTVTARGVKLGRLALGAVALGLSLIAAWKIGCVVFHIHDDLTSGVRLRLASRVLHPGNWLQILGALILQTRVLLPLALAAAFTMRYRHDPYFRFVLSAAAIYFATLVLVYLSTPYDLTWHLATSADRTILPVALGLAYAVLSTNGMERGPGDWAKFGASHRIVA